MAKENQPHKLSSNSPRPSQDIMIWCLLATLWVEEGFSSKPAHMSATLFLLHPLSIDNTSVSIHRKCKPIIISLYDSHPHFLTHARTKPAHFHMCASLFMHPCLLLLANPHPSLFERFLYLGAFFCLRMWKKMCAHMTSKWMVDAFCCVHGTNSGRFVGGTLSSLQDVYAKKSTIGIAHMKRFFF